MKKLIISFSAAIITFSIGLLLGHRNPSGNGVTMPVVSDVSIQRPGVEESAVKPIEDLPATDEKGVYAWYYPPNDASQLRGEVAFISLSSEPTRNDGSLVYEAGVMTNFYDDVDRDYALAVKTNVTGDRLTFRTKTVKGVSFSFDGRFFKGRKTGEQNEPVLRGTLTRLVKGKPAGSFTGDFGFAEPHCLH